MTRPLIGPYQGSNQGAQGVAAYGAWMGAPADISNVFTGQASQSDYENGVGWNINADGWTGRKMVSIPLLWNSVDGGPAGPTLAQAAAGAINASYTKAAQAAAAALAGQAAPWIIRTGWEFNGNWEDWQADNSATLATAYAGAFRQFYDCFHAVSPNFELMWCYTEGQGDPTPAYPGDDITAHIAGDFYWGAQWDDPITPDGGTAAFEQQRDMQYGIAWGVAFAAAHKKPFSVPEMGVSSDDAENYVDMFLDYAVANDFLLVILWDSNSAYPGQLSKGQYPKTAAAWRAKVLAIQGVTPTASPAPAPVAPPPAPITVTTGANGMTTITLSAPLAAGSYTITPVLMPLVVSLSADIYVTGDDPSGDPLVNVTVDGNAVITSLPISAVHGKATQAVALGSYPAGQHSVGVAFTNDAYGGTAATDRNLYVDTATFGTAVETIEAAQDSGGVYSFTIGG